MVPIKGNKALVERQQNFETAAVGILERTSCKLPGQQSAEEAQNNRDTQHSRTSMTGTTSVFRKTFRLYRAFQIGRDISTSKSCTGYRDVSVINCSRYRGSTVPGFAVWVSPSDLSETVPARGASCTNPTVFHPHCTALDITGIRNHNTRSMECNPDSMNTTTEHSEFNNHENGSRG